MKLAATLLAVAIALTGCASKRQLTRDEYIAATTRQYQSTSAETVINAAEKVLRLADGDDFIIQHTEDGFTASRRWLVYLIIGAAMGVDHWRFSAKESDGSVIAKVSVATQSGNLTPVGNTVMHMPSNFGTEVRGNSLYDTFWRRVDYTLGKSSEWTTCDMASQRRKDGITFGLDEAICNSFNMADQLPEELRKDKPQSTNPYN